MKIAGLVERRTFAIQDAPVPEIEPDEVLVRVAACGVCSSELEIWAGEETSGFPLYLGHEVSGTVEEAGAEVADLAMGDPVGVWVTTRGYADYVAVKAEHCRPAGDVPLDLVMAEPLACAANAVELADVRLGDDVVLVGAGFMGNLVHQLVRLRGVRTLVVADTRPDALAQASRLGATQVVDVGRESLADVVSEVTGGRGADITFECTGSQSALGVVGDVTRMSGTIVLVGFHQGASRTIPLAGWNWMAFTIANAHFREVATIMRGMTIASRLLSSHLVSLEPLITHRFPLSRIGEAFETSLAKPPGFTKAVVTFDASTG